VDKGKEVVAGVIDSAGKLADKVNPLNNIGFHVILGLGAFVLVEFMNSSSGVALAKSVPMLAS